VASNGATNPGELNFRLTLVIRAYLRKHGTSYQTINDVVGAIVRLNRSRKEDPFPTSGSLEWELALLCVGYKEDFPLRADIAGALECCKLEFYRRVAVPYEDQKIKSNGDVY
jgi:hypothetical protein